MVESATTAVVRVERLTHSQRECLRLVLAHMTSKQISRELGISPHTVDAHLKAALKTLDVANRTEAALILAKAEGVSAYQPLAHQPLVMVNQQQSMAFSTHGIAQGKDVDYAELVQSESEQTRNIVQDGLADKDLFSGKNWNDLNQQTIGSQKTFTRTNNFSIEFRIFIIIGISILSIIVFSVIVSALQSLSSMYQ